ncbi:MAG: hypothetical protein GWP91_03035 [Rhodobacterales bacterium]|nr:hypothetical protein [Rhodobacterales bacterium]
MIWLLFNIAFAVDVNVVGVGPTSLEVATASCLDGTALPTSTPRISAFVQVAQTMLAKSEAERLAYYPGQSDDLWPADRVHINTIPALPMTENGSIAACAAVGRYWIEEGQRLQVACVEKKVCKASVPSDVWKSIYQLTLQTDAETFYIGLRKHEPPLGVWQDPLPFLDKACAGPQDASDHKLLVDVHDVTAGRQACLQLLTLVEGTVPTTVHDSCQSPWASTQADASSLILVSGTTQSVGPRVGSGHRTRLHTLLAAMDPSGVDCRGWGDLHRGSVVARWRSEQAKSACDDESLHLKERALLCPQFRGKEQGRCMMGQSDACMRAAKMTLDGIGTEPLVQPAVELYNKACDLGDVQGCGRVTAHVGDITSWFTAALVSAQPLAPEVVSEPEADEPVGDPAPTLPDGTDEAIATAIKLVDDYGSHLPSQWAVNRSRDLLKYYLSAWMAPEATALIRDTPQLDEEVTKPALERIEELEVRLDEIADEETKRLALEAEAEDE